MYEPICSFGSIDGANGCNGGWNDGGRSGSACNNGDWDVAGPCWNGGGKPKYGQGSNNFASNGFGYDGGSNTGVSGGGSNGWNVGGYGGGSNGGGSNGWNVGGYGGGSNGGGQRRVLVSQEVVVVEGNLLVSPIIGRVVVGPTLLTVIIKAIYQSYNIMSEYMTQNNLIPSY